MFGKIRRGKHGGKLKPFWQTQQTIRVRSLKPMDPRESVWKELCMKILKRLLGKEATH